MANNRQALLRERMRIRDARYVPGPRYQEKIEVTLMKLPKIKRRSFQDKLLIATAIAAALTVFLVFGAPPIVKAAQPFIQRLFGDVAQQKEQEHALSDDEKLEQMIENYESGYRWHEVDGASQTLGDVQISVVSVSVSPIDYYDRGNPKGELDLTMTYSAIPPFDPNYVDFTLLVDGKQSPQRITENLAAFRAEKQQTLTEAEWSNGWTQSNSELLGGVPTTWLWFDTDDWKWDQPKQLELRAEINGQQLSIPFTFDPVKAHENAVEMAEESVRLMDQHYEAEKPVLDEIVRNAAEIGLTGNAYGYDYTLSEMSVVDGKLYFGASFSGVTEHNPRLVDFWIDRVLIDGFPTSPMRSTDGELADGVYSATYVVPLGRDPRNLPAESLICVQLIMGYDGTETGEYGIRSIPMSEFVAFHYNWAERKITLPKDEAEMLQWVEQAEVQLAELYSEYPKNLDYIRYDLSGLNLSQDADDVTMTLTDVYYCSNRTIGISVNIEGDVEGSQYKWYIFPRLKIDGFIAENSGGSSFEDGNTYTYHIRSPLAINEFKDGVKINVDFPLFKEGDEYDDTYAEPERYLHYEFTIDGQTMPREEVMMEPVM